MTRMAIALVAVAGAAVAAQQSTQQPAQPPAGQQRGPQIDPLVLDDRQGFEPIFDGKTMNGWDGDPQYWRVENGALVGETVAERPVKENSFVIWRGGEPKDFELKVQFRINSTNSGIQFRSVYLPPGTQGQGRPVEGKWVLRGLQADIDFDNRWTGQLYEERGRTFLATRGQAVYVGEGSRPRLIGTLQQTPDEIKALIKQNDWNQVHVIARGNTIIQIVNGTVSSIVVDDDAKGKTNGGMLGFQVHVGPPMKVEFRNIWLKKL
jgi:hypothetical protein